MIQFPSQMNKNPSTHTQPNPIHFTAAQLEQKNVHTLKTAFNHWYATYYSGFDHFPWKRGS